MSWLRSRVKTDGGAESIAATDAPIELESIIALYYPFIWRILRGLGLSNADAEDATQQVFMIAARKLSGVEPDRVRSFLYGTAVRVASNARRGIRRRRESQAEPDDLDERADDTQGPEELSEARNARALLHELLEQLPDKLRRTLVLAELEQLELRTIAELEGIPTGTAASRLRLARARFRELLAGARHRNPFAGES